MTERLNFHFSLSCIGEGNGNPLQGSCLENPRDGGAWWASVHGVTQSRTQLKWLSSSSSSSLHCFPFGECWSKSVCVCVCVCVCVPVIPVTVTSKRHLSFLPLSFFPFSLPLSFSLSPPSPLLFTIFTMSLLNESLGMLHPFKHDEVAQ